MGIKSAKIIVRDVGFGDSIYVKVRRGDNSEGSYLIDTGYLGEAKQYKNELRDINVKQIDTLILTHKHSDHISAAHYIIEHYEYYGLKNIFLSFKDMFFASNTNKKLSNKLKKIYSDKLSKINIFDINDENAVKAILDFYVLYPNKYTQSYPSDINRNSIVLLLGVGEYGVLFTGDITNKEDLLILRELQKYNIKEINALKIAHHGSSTSTSRELLHGLSSLKYAIVSSNAKRRYKLPSREFEARWSEYENNHDSRMFYTEDENIRQNIQLIVNSDTGCDVICDCRQKFFSSKS